ncbi:MAG: ABC transporter ATP-binding protein [Hyphomonadaceae bacterium]|nr:ABC transporter ATP-binding protein [Hyphomonadaceae bacterium]
MASLTVENVTMEYPIFGASARSFRSAVLGVVGGGLVRNAAAADRVVVRSLEDVSFNLEHGDRLGLIGPNGAGKSTLLRMLAGVYEPVMGRVVTEGRVSALFVAAPGIDPDDSGFDNIRTCCMYLGMSASEIAEKHQSIADFTELGEYLELPVRTYSAGMTLRLSFAIATSIDPDILLLDEGLGAGDARFAAKAEARMNELIGRSNIMVIASHADSIISALCNKAAFLEHGRLVAFGPVEETIAKKNELLLRAADA